SRVNVGAQVVAVVAALVDVGRVTVAVLVDQRVDAAERRITRVHGALTAVVAVGGGPGDTRVRAQVAALDAVARVLVVAARVARAAERAVVLAPVAAGVVAVVALLAVLEHAVAAPGADTLAAATDAGLAGGAVLGGRPGDADVPLEIADLDTVPAGRVRAARVLGARERAGVGLAPVERRLVAVVALLARADDPVATDGLDADTVDAARALRACGRALGRAPVRPRACIILAGFSGTSRSQDHCRQERRSTPAH